MHDKSNVFWAYCAHAAAICPELLGVRQPGSAIAPAGLPAIWIASDTQPDSFPYFPYAPTPSLLTLFCLAVHWGSFGRVSSSIPEHEEPVILAHTGAGQG